MSPMLDARRGRLEQAEKRLRRALAIKEEFRLSGAEPACMLEESNR